MNKEYLYLLHLLKSFIHEEPPCAQDDIDWKKMNQLAEIHSVEGILGYMVKQYKLSPSPEFTEIMRKKCFCSIGLYNKRGIQMQQLIQKMQEEHIEHILFKGYVLKDYYPIPELRSYGDIDFVIHPEDREKSHQLMLREKFQVKTDWEPVYSYYKFTEYYEIHTDVMEVDVSEKADYREYFQHMWEHAVQVDGCTWQFTPEYHFIYLLTHIAKHIYGSGAGARMYLDLAVFILHFGKGIDWDFVSQELHKIELYDFYCVALTAVKEWFAVDSPIELKPIAKEVMDEFLVYTLEAGVFGYVNRERGVNALKKNAEDAESVSRVSTLLHRIFPSASDIEKRYTYLKGRHWLLPVAWVHRFFRTKETWGSHAHEAKVIMSADSEEVVRLRKIYKDIGL